MPPTESGRCFDGQQDPAEPPVHPALVGQAAAQVASEDQAPAGLAPSNRFAAPTACAKARQEILDGKRDVSVLLNEKVGEIKATIIEKDGKIVMVKDCPIHGHFET